MDCRIGRVLTSCLSQGICNTRLSATGYRMERSVTVVRSMLSRSIRNGTFWAISIFVRENILSKLSSSSLKADSIYRKLTAACPKRVANISAYHHTGTQCTLDKNKPFFWHFLLSLLRREIRLKCKTSKPTKRTTYRSTDRNTAYINWIV